jgi:NTP pyrophosphatase (non-canonical NTP hydrolase)
MNKEKNDYGFQGAVGKWALKTFGVRVASNNAQRNHRFLEEALELVQAAGCTEAEARMLVDYVYSRPIGEVKQEVGGVMITLSALCFMRDIDMMQCGEDELTRICTPEVTARIQAKQATKPASGPLPGAAAPLVPEHVALLYEALDFGQFSDDFHIGTSQTVRRATRQLLEDLRPTFYGKVK